MHYSKGKNANRFVETAKKMQEAVELRSAQKEEIHKT